jgi:hypothetical protein
MKFGCETNIRRSVNRVMDGTINAVRLSRSSDDEDSPHPSRLGQAYVRWIDLRTCPEDEASLSRARTAMTDRKLNPLDGARQRPWQRPPQDARLFPSPLASPSNRYSQGAVCRALIRVNESELTLEPQSAHAPDPRLVKFARLLARRAAREWYQQVVEERRPKCS